MSLDFSKARIAIVGDAMIDVWHYGHWSKITGEGTPAFLIERTEELPGGAANVKANIEALGARAHLFSKDNALCPRKTRYSARGAVFRADMEDCQPIGEPIIASIMGHLEALPKPDVIVLSDYAKGVCTPELCQAVIGLGIPVVVDPKGKSWGKYSGAAIITPNEAEYLAWDGYWEIGWRAILKTLGARGMVLEPRTGRPMAIPSVAREARDVTGAGDTVVATLAACLAIGMDISEAACIANAAASVVVGKWATATCSLAELEAAL